MIDARARRERVAGASRRTRGNLVVICGVALAAMTACGSSGSAGAPVAAVSSPAPPAVGRRLRVQENIRSGCCRPGQCRSPDRSPLARSSFRWFAPARSFAFPFLVELKLIHTVLIG